MKNPFPPYPREKMPPLEDRPSISTLPPPLSPEDRLRDALKILNHLDCEYEINFHDMLFTRKNIKHESH